MGLAVRNTTIGLPKSLGKSRLSWRISFPIFADFKRPRKEMIGNVMIVPGIETTDLIRFAGTDFCIIYSLG